MTDFASNVGEFAFYMAWVIGWLTATTLLVKGAFWIAGKAYDFLHIHDSENEHAQKPNAL